MIKNLRDAMYPSDEILGKELAATVGQYLDDAYELDQATHYVHAALMPPNKYAPINQQLSTEERRAKLAAARERQAAATAVISEHDSHAQIVAALNDPETVSAMAERADRATGAAATVYAKAVVKVTEARSSLRAAIDDKARVAVIAGTRAPRNLPNDPDTINAGGVLDAMAREARAWSRNDG